jgi:feruloyl esterase
MRARLSVSMLALLAGGAPPAVAADCGALAGLAVPGARVTSAQVVTSLTGTRGTVALAAPACRVLVTARPSPDSDVRIAVIIPEGSAWNGKFAQLGNGGFAGQIPWASLALGLKRGYAVAGTDDGHQDSDGTSAKWAIGHPEKVTDFGWRAVKATTDVANAVLAGRGAAPSTRYFVGCSDGGREALMTAQRFPGDFDGIVAGAPAWPWSRMIGIGADTVRQSLLPGRALPPAKLPALTDAALKACGNASLDKGGWIENPRTCKFDPAVIACKGAASDACLTPGEVTTARAIYAGRRDPVTGENFPGLVPGAEAVQSSWSYWGRATAAGDVSQATSDGFPWNWMAYLVKDNPAYDLRKLTDADIIAGYRRWGATLDADNPDLSAFEAHGGKLISYHGWNDPAIPPGLTLDYWRKVKAKTPRTDGFYRLFMVPGMLHCSGGNAPANVDWFAEIDKWVTSGKAPETIIATGKDGAQRTVTRER